MARPRAQKLLHFGDESRLRSYIKHVDDGQRAQDDASGNIWTFSLSELEWQLTEPIEGAQWYDGAVDPDSSIGVENDLYLNTTSGDVFKKSDDGWGTAIGNILGPVGDPGADGTPGSIWYSSSGAPSGGLGIDGDFYLDTANGDVYEKLSGVWTLEGNIRGPTGSTGSAGANGATWYTGNGVPDSGLGSDNDLYLNLNNGDVYEKISGAWTIEGSIRGSSGSSGVTGKQWYVGSGDPGSSTGYDGDFYYDQTGKDFYEKATTPATMSATQKLTETGTPASSNYTTAGTVAATNSKECVVAVFNVSDTGGNPGVPTSIAGAGLTWALLGSVSDTSNRSGKGVSISLWRGYTTSGASTGALTITGNLKDKVAVHAVEFTNTDASYGANGSVVQVGLGTPVAATSITGELSTFADATNNATYSAVSHRTAEATTQEGGYTELGDNNADGVGYETAWKLGGDTTPSASWTTSSTANIIALELKAAAGTNTWSKIGVLIGAGTPYSATPADPTGVGNTTGLMQGLAGSFTPKGTRMKVTITGMARADTATNGQGWKTRIRYGTGSAPTNGAALTGTAVGNQPQGVVVGSVTMQRVGFTCTAVVTGLTAGTAYWLDLELATLVSAAITANVFDLAIVAEDA